MEQQEQSIQTSLENQPQYAGFGRRFFASSLDGIISTVISYIILLPLGWNPFQVRVGSSAHWTSVLISTFVGALYLILFWVNGKGATPGKKLFGIKIVQVNDSPINYSKAILRWLGYIVSGLPLFLGYLWIIWDKEKRGWHDKIAGTKVIKIDKRSKVIQAILVAILLIIFYAIFVGAGIYQGLKEFKEDQGVREASPTPTTLSQVNELIKSGNLKLSTANQLAGKPSLTENDKQQISGLINGAISDFKEVTRLDPNNAAAWYNLGHAYKALIGIAEDADKWAINSYKKVQSINPDSYLSYLEIGGVHFLQGDYEKSIENFQKVVELEPDLANGYYNLGVAYKMIGSRTEARKALEKALELLPEDHEDRYKAEKELSNL